MKPRRFNLASPTTTAKVLNVHEFGCLLTINNMNSTIDLYFSDEGADALIWERIPAGTIMEIMGDFGQIWYKAASNFVAGTDYAHALVEKVD